MERMEGEEEDRKGVKLSKTNRSEREGRRDEGSKEERKEGCEKSKGKE